MKQKRLFGSIASAMFLGLMALTSCVQTDFYDEFYDDMSSESMIARRKFKADYNSSGQLVPQSATSEDDIIKAREWVNNCSTPARSECAAYAFSNFSGRSLPQIRNEIGNILMHKYGYGPNWEYAYKQMVEHPNGGVVLGDAVALISCVVGAHPVTTNWMAYFNSFSDPSDPDRIVITEPVIVGIDGTHLGLLRGVICRGGSWYLVVKDPIDDYSGYAINRLTSVWK